MRHSDGGESSHDEHRQPMDRMGPGHVGQFRRVFDLPRGVFQHVVERRRRRRDGGKIAVNTVFKITPDVQLEFCCRLFGDY